MRILLFFIGFLYLTGVAAQTQDPEAIRQQMTRIRQSTNWKDKEAAARANKEIAALAKQLMMTKAVPAEGGGVPGEGETTEANIDLKLQLWGEIWSSIRQGENANLDLAKPVREIIKKEYEEDSDHTLKSQELLNAISVLTINMSMPGIDAVINQMPYYKNIHTLVIICEEPVPVDLADLFDKASAYPLEQLYVINFRNMVTSIPSSVGSFNNLKELSLIGNDISALPPSIAELGALKKIYVNINPLQSLIASLNPAQQLAEIGLKNTNVTDTEKEQLRQMFPECKIIE